jgi:bacteriocin-like protein
VYWWHTDRKRSLLQDGRYNLALIKPHKIVKEISMRELTTDELEKVSGGASATEYIILLTQPETETFTSQVLKTRHDTAKNSIGNIR